MGTLSTLLLPPLLVSPTPPTQASAQTTLVPLSPVEGRRGRPRLSLKLMLTMLPMVLTPMLLVLAMLPMVHTPMPELLPLVLAMLPMVPTPMLELLPPMLLLVMLLPILLLELSTPPMLESAPTTLEPRFLARQCIVSGQ